MLKEPTAKMGRVAGLQIRAGLSAAAAMLAIAGGVFLLLRKLLKWQPGTAVAGGIMASAIHFLSEFWHQYGHARAAQETGFPMSGVTLVGPVGLSVYPKNEGLLPAETHIQRALGGPLFSLILALGTGTLSLLLRPIGGLPLFLTFFAFLDNALVFTVGALLPLGFTDGSTLLAWWDQAGTALIGRRRSLRLR
ncbi:MAG: hypothetical protein ACK2UK_13610 [Candidatus Promineifilaceae bacterium]